MWYDSHVDRSGWVEQDGVRYYQDFYGDPVSGWASQVCITLFVSGVQLFCTGIVGQYLAKTYMEVKKRPIYLVKEEL